MSTYERLRQIKPTGISRNLLDDTDDWVGLLHVSQLGEVIEYDPDNPEFDYIGSKVVEFVEEWNLKTVNPCVSDNLLLHRINAEWFALITEL